MSAKTLIDSTPNTSYVCCARVKGSFEAEGGSELLVQSFDDHMICNQPGIELDVSGEIR